MALPSETLVAWRVLAAIAFAPGASNVEIAARAQIVDLATAVELNAKAACRAVQYRYSIGRRFDLQRRPSACASATAVVRFVCAGRYLPGTTVIVRIASERSVDRPSGSGQDR
jgi:hypothetical protein